tara:strand:- start:4 stop:609 length:606 start_codon:yes stop_codon:yes gene_type:complete
MKDYKNLFVASIICTIYIILLHNNKLNNFKSYIETTHGKMLVILLILLTLQRDIQIGMILTLIYVLTDIHNDSDDIFQVEKFKNYKKSKKTENFKNNLDEINKDIEELFNIKQSKKSKRSKNKKTSVENIQTQINMRNDKIEELKEKIALLKQKNEAYDDIDKHDEFNYDIEDDLEENMDDKRAAERYEPFINFTGNYSKF